MHLDPEDGSIIDFEERNSPEKVRKTVAQKSRCANTKERDRERGRTGEHKKGRKLNIEKEDGFDASSRDSFVVGKRGVVGARIEELTESWDLDDGQISEEAGCGKTILVREAGKRIQGKKSAIGWRGGGLRGRHRAQPVACRGELKIRRR